MYNKKLFNSFYSCLLVVLLICTNILADEDARVPVDKQSFGIENFFDLKEISFSKDKVNFNKGWLGIFMENAE